MTLAVTGPLVGANSSGGLAVSVAISQENLRKGVGAATYLPSERECQLAKR